jgi:hypothetical protein
VTGLAIQPRNDRAIADCDIYLADLQICGARRRGRRRLPQEDELILRKINQRGKADRHANEHNYCADHNPAQYPLQRHMRFSGYGTS